MNTKRMLWALVGTVVEGAWAVAFAAGGGAGGGGVSWLTVAFLAFGGLVVLTQALPAVLMVAVMLRGLIAEPREEAGPTR
ncbi:hypothetical protein [Deferrisoma palaeochoriense]